MRRFEGAPVATRAAFIAAPATQPAAQARSRSAPQQRLGRGSDTSQRRLTIGPSDSTAVLPAKYRPRARSAPTLRLPPPTRTTSKALSLGESLRYSSCAMVHSAKASPLSTGTPAARMFFDPSTGRTLALRTLALGCR